MRLPFFYLPTMKRWILLIFLPVYLSAQEAQPLAKIALGSCSKENLPELQMRDEINAENPDLWVWLGDIIYGNSNHIDTLRVKYARQKSLPGYQEHIANTEVIGIWDDHDYGVNDGDCTYPRKGPFAIYFSSFSTTPKIIPPASTKVLINRTPSALKASKFASSCSMAATSAIRSDSPTATTPSAIAPIPKANYSAKRNGSGSKSNSRTHPPKSISSPGVSNSSRPVTPTRNGVISRSNANAYLNY